MACGHLVNSNMCWHFVFKLGGWQMANWNFSPPLIPPFLYLWVPFELPFGAGIWPQPLPPQPCQWHHVFFGFVLIAIRIYSYFWYIVASTPHSWEICATYVDLHLMVFKWMFKTSLNIDVKGILCELRELPTVKKEREIPSCLSMCGCEDVDCLHVVYLCRCTYNIVLLIIYLSV